MLMKVLLKGKKESNIKIAQYKKIRLKFDFPKISDLAFDINYLYRYDGYLPTFIFNLIYKVPKGSKIKPFEVVENGVIRLQTLIEMEKYSIVRYTEFDEYAA